MGIPTKRRAPRAFLVAVFLLGASACGGSGSETPTPESAITGFDTSSRAIEASFHRIARVAHGDPAGLRQAALQHLRDEDPDTHYAAVYSLALTADGSSGAKQLRDMLSSSDVDEELLAAGRLIAIGDRSSIPILIDALADPAALSFRDPPQHAYDLARSELLLHTTRDFGLDDATTASAIAATQPAWRRWWATAGPSLRFDPDTSRFMG